MSSSQFILNYQGNKFKETKHLAHLDFTSYDTIVEVFGGSFGFIRYLYYELGLKNKRYIVYDNHKDLIEFYRHMNSFDLSKYNELCTTIFEKFTTKKDKSQIYMKPAREWIIEHVSDPHLRFCLLWNLTTCRVSRVYWKQNLNLDIFRHIEFKHIEEFSPTQFSPETTLFYLDPPYIFECNRWYDNPDGNDCFTLILTLMKSPYHTLLIHPANVVIDHIFNSFFFQKYNVQYRNMGKKTIHHIYLTQPPLGSRGHQI